MVNLKTYQNKRVLVTGANGLLGAHIVEKLLKANANVFALALDIDHNSYYQRNVDKSQFREYLVDINDSLGLERVVSQVQPEIIIHLAAETQVKTGFLNPKLTFTTNVMGTLNLLEIIRNSSENVEQIVVASTDKVYGEAKVLPYTEETELRAHGPYDTSKACMDLMCQSFANTYDLPVTILRAGNIYGPGDLNWDRIIPGVCRWLLQNEQPILRSTGEMIRDYIYVEDVALAYLYAGAPRERTNNLSIFNVSSNNPMKVMQLYEKLCVLLVNQHVEPLIRQGNVPEIAEQRLDSSLIYNQLGWKPTFTIDESLLKTITWYRELKYATNN